MKLLKRNLFYLIIGIATVLFFIYIFVMYRLEFMDDMEFVSCCFVMIMMAGGAAMIAISKTKWFKQKKESTLDPSSIEVPHTREGIIYEAITGLILVIAWVVSIASMRFWMNKDLGVFFNQTAMFVVTIISITLLWFVYSPDLKTKFKKLPNMEQVALEVRMCRCLAVEFALSALVFVRPYLDGYSIIFICIIGVALFATIAIFRYLIYKARTKPEDIKQDGAIGGFDLDKVKIPRTALSTLTEILVGILIVAAWVIALKRKDFFDGFYFGLQLIFSMYAIKLIWDTYRPGNMIDMMTKLTNLKQVKLAAWQYRIGALTIAIFLLLFNSFLSLNATWWPLLIGWSVVWMIVFFIFHRLINRARD